MAHTEIQKQYIKENQTSWKSSSRPQNAMIPLGDRYLMHISLITLHLLLRYAYQLSMVIDVTLSALMSNLSMSGNVKSVEDRKHLFTDALQITHGSELLNGPTTTDTWIETMYIYFENHCYNMDHDNYTHIKTLWQLSACVLEYYTRWIIFRMVWDAILIMDQTKCYE